VNIVAGAARKPTLCVQGKIAWKRIFWNNEHGMVNLVRRKCAIVAWLADEFLIIDKFDRPALGVRDMADRTRNAPMRAHLNIRYGSRGQKKRSCQEPTRR
jgi:hypothetical protein